MENNDPRDKIRLVPPIYFLLGLSPGVVLHLVTPITFSYQKMFFVLGIVVLAISFLLAIATLRSLRRANTGVHIRHESIALVTSGTYHFSRNPLYLSLLLLIIASGLLLNAFWIIASTPLIIGLVSHLVIRHEEHYLEQQFGSRYRKYCQRVRRWI